MNGSIWVESEVGKGSTFHFTVGMQVEQHASATDSTSGNRTASSSVSSVLLGKQILLAEDNAVNQKLAVRLLQKMGCQVVVAKNGKEALAALEREEPFDVV